jgi:hypothetical protein
MITAEIKINGCLIGHLYLVNKGTISEKKDDFKGIYDKCFYDGHFYIVETGESIPIDCHHYRSQGAIKLINIATNAVLKQLSKRRK